MASVLLEARPYRPFKSSEEYLYAMREDLAEWLNTLYPQLLINVDNFMDRLDTGIALCKVRILIEFCIVCFAFKIIISLRIFFFRSKTVWTSQTNNVGDKLKMILRSSSRNLVKSLNINFYFPFNKSSSLDDENTSEKFRWTCSRT